jgi:hypothetical protein
MTARTSLVTLLLLMCSMIWTVTRKPVEGVLNWDVTGYYMYWPATVIYHDLTITDRSWAENLRQQYDLSGTLYQFHKPEGRENFVNQYTCGMAIFYAPAFWAGHWLAPALSYPQDGFSPPYQLAIAYWSLFIALAGLWALRKLLLLFFSDALVAVLLFITVFATNYYIQINSGLATPHNYLFLLYCLFLISVVQWHRHYKAKYAAFMALCYGAMCLIRPTEIIAVFIPLLWNTVSWASFKEKMRLVWTTHRRSLWLVVAVVALFALPQMIYWKLAAGRWLYMSYSNPGEGFDLLSPHTLNFLFSYRKGWFIYTPLMLFAFIGFFWLWKKERSLFLAFGVFVFLNLYLVSSWSNWWYAQCFSQRAMVHTLPVMILLLGWAFSWCRGTRVRRLTGFSVASAMVVLTIFFSWQYAHGILDQWRMTKDYFWAVILQTSPVDEATKDLLLVPRDFSGVFTMHRPETYEVVQSYRYSSLFPGQLKTYLNDTLRMGPVEAIDTRFPYSKAIQFPFKTWTKKDHAWLRGYAEVFVPAGHTKGDVLLVATANHKAPYGYQTFETADSAFVPNAWNKIRFLYLTPEVRVPKDPINIYIWYRGADSCLLRDIYVETLEKVR